MWLSSLISGIVFIALRTCFKPQIKLDIIPERKQVPNVDTIITIKTTMDFFTVCFVPLLLVIYLCVPPNLAKHSIFFAEVYVIGISSFLSTIFSILVIFLDYTKGSALKKKIAPILIKVLCHFIFLIIPLINIAVFVYCMVFIDTPMHDNPLTNFVVFYSILCIG